MIRKNKLKYLAVHESTYNILKNCGTCGDSFNEVIMKLLENYGMKTGETKEVSV